MPDDDLSAFREFIEQSLNLDPLFADQEDVEAAYFFTPSRVLLDSDAERVALALAERNWGQTTRPRSEVKRYVPATFLGWIPDRIFYGVPALVFLLLLLLYGR